MKTFWELVAFIFSTLFIAITVITALRQRYFPSALFGLFALFFFILGYQYNHEIEQLLCWMVGASFFVFALHLFNKEKTSYGFIVLLISIAAFVIGLSPIQALLKTHLLWQVNTSLNKLGTKMDVYIDQLAEMQTNLDANQIEIASNNVAITLSQKGLTNQQFIIHAQYEKILTVSSNLDAAVITISNQEKQLSDVEYWVQNLYANVTNETFSSKDTNHIVLVSNTDGSTAFIYRLSKIPINGSVESYVRDGNSFAETRVAAVDLVQNIGMNTLYKFDTNTTSLAFKYVIDTRATNFYKQMPILNKDFFMLTNGGIHLNFSQN